MSIASTGDALLAYLWSDSSEGGHPLSDAVATVVPGEGLLSRQVELSSTIEELSESGLVERTTGADGRVDLSLTDEGREAGRDAFRRIAAAEVELVDDAGHRTCSVEAAASETGRTVPELAVRCSEDGTFVAADADPREGFVDRETEREAWSGLLDRCEGGSGGELFMIEGVSGIGKTTLAEKLASEARDREAVVDVVETTCGGDSTRSYGPVRSLVEAVGEDDPFTDAGTDPDDLDAHSDGADTYRGLRSSLFESVTERLLPGQGIRVLVVDDLHRADAATVEYFGHLFERLHDLPIVVLATSLPGELADSTLQLDALAEGATPLSRFDLGGFDPSDTARLIEQVVGQRGVPTAFVDAVQERTDGQPFHVETTVEALVEADELDPKYRWYPDDPNDIALPGAVGETVTESIAGLESLPQELLRWTAVAGEPLPIDLLATLCDRTPEAIAPTIELLVETDQLHRIEDGGPVIMRTELTREALLAAMAADERRDRHEAIARALVEHGGDDHAATIARQYEHADRPAEAVRWYETAIDQATDVYAHETAIEHSHRALRMARAAGNRDDIVSTSESLIAVYSTIGEYEQADQYVQFVRERMGDEHPAQGSIAYHAAAIATARSNYDEAEAEVERGLELAGDRDPLRARLLDVAAEIHRQRGEYDEATDVAEALLSLSREIDQPAFEADALQHLGTIDWQEGDYERARERLEESDAIGDRLDDPMIEAEALHNLGLIDWDLGTYESGEDVYERCLELRRSIGDRHGEARALNNLGIIASSAGDHDAAKEYYEQSMVIHRELGNPHDEARCLHNIGTIFGARTNHEQAVEYYRRCLEIERDLDDRHGEAMVLTNLGRIAQFQGDYETALEHQADALAVKRDHDIKRGISQSLVYRGATKRGQGEYEAAREDILDGLEIAREQSLPQERSEALTELGITEHAAGNNDDAREHLQAAIDAGQQADDPLEVARARIRYAHVLVDSGDVDAAVAVLDRAEAPIEAEDATHWIGRHRLVQGDLAAERGDPSTARERWETALDRFEAVDATHDVVRALERLVEAAVDAGDDDRVRALTERGLEVTEATDEEAIADRYDWFDRQRNQISG